MSLLSKAVRGAAKVTPAVIAGKAIAHAVAPAKPKAKPAAGVLTNTNTVKKPVTLAEKMAGAAKKKGLASVSLR